MSIYSNFEQVMGNFGLHLREGGRRELLYRDNQINLCAKLTFDSFRISTFLQIRPAEEGLHLQEFQMAEIAITFIV